MRLAIIGGGAAGMITAYLLNRHHHVTVIEKQPMLGGNIRTLNKNVTNVNLDPAITLDNGVIEFQQDHFIHFHKLMTKLNVQMAQIQGGATTLLLSNGQAISSPEAISRSQRSWLNRIQAYLKLLPIAINYQQFLHKTKSPQAWHNRPMADFWCGDTWRKWQRMLLMYAYSIPYHQIDAFPAEIGATVLRQSGQGTRWTRVVGGVYTYIEKILETLKGEILLNTDIQSIVRQPDGVLITLASGNDLRFDKLVFALPPDQVLTLLADPTPAERRRFSAWQANQATTTIHTDTTVYQRYGVSYFSEFDLFEKEGGHDAGYNAYLNRLSGLQTTQPPHYNLAYNLEDWIDPATIVHKQLHHTPLYTTEAVQFRQEVRATNGENHTYHAGAYLGNGLHEGAVVSALAVSQLLGGDIF